MNGERVKEKEGGCGTNLIQTNGPRDLEEIDRTSNVGCGDRGNNFREDDAGELSLVV